MAVVMRYQMMKNWFTQEDVMVVRDSKRDLSEIGGYISGCYINIILLELSQQLVSFFYLFISFSNV